MKKLLLTLLLLLTTNGYAATVDVYKHDGLNTRYMSDGCMIKTIRTDVFIGTRGYFTIVNKRRSYFFTSLKGKHVLYVQSTAGKAIMVGKCVPLSITLDEAISTYKRIIQDGDGRNRPLI